MDHWIDDRVNIWGEGRGLTAAECHVAKHAIRGQSNKEIGAAIGVGVPTVRTHLVSICKKLGVSSRGELAYGFFRESWALLSRTVPRPKANGMPAGRTRWRVLVVSSSQALRSLALAALDDLGVTEATVLHEDSARALLELGWVVHGVVLDLTTVAEPASIASILLGRNAHAIVLAVSDEPTGPARARRIGAIYLPAPFTPEGLGRFVERTLREANG